MKQATTPHAKDGSAPSLGKRGLVGKKTSEKKVIRKIILLFGLLVSAIVGNTIFTTYQENRDASIHTYKDLESKLKMALAIQNSQLSKLKTITGIIREQNQRFCEFMDYDNLPAVAFMLKSTATIHDIDLAFVFDEYGEFLTSYPKIRTDGNNALFNSLISNRKERVDVEAIPYSIISTHFPEFSSFEKKSQALSFKSVSQLVHDTGDIYGYVVLLKLIDGNKQMAEQMARIVEVEVAYFDADKKLILTSFSDADIPYTKKGAITFDGNAYFLRSAKIDDFLGNTIGTLLVALNKTPFIQHQRRLLINNLTPFFISIIISAGLFFLLKTKVFNKINQLIAALRKVAEGEGDLSIRVKVPPKKMAKKNLDEVEHMGIDFNRMMDKLEDTHRQLIKARKEAELASTLKGEFLANMSHEIRTPMNAVIGYTDMLLEGQLSKEQQEYADTIKSSGDTLLALINDILDFSKIEAGELDFDENDFEPESIVYEVCDIIRPRIGEKPIEIACSISPRVPRFVHGDPGRFRQVLTNLMGNAPKFTESGEIELSVDVAEEIDERIKLHCRIRDTGIGIPQEKLISIFEPFKQADGTTTRRFGGTGLGLSICKKISNLLGGDVWAESPSKRGTKETLNHSETNTGLKRPETGSLFHFTAWFKKVEGVNPASSIPISLARKKVLIVDDNTTNLNILSHVLKRVEMEVVSLQNSREVLPILESAFIKKTPFDVAIIDIQMPEMDGYDVAKMIRAAQSPIQDLPLIALSSVLERDARGNLAWFDRFLTKPIRRDRLYAELKRVFDGRKAPPTVPKQAGRETPRENHSIREKETPGKILLVEDNLVNQKLAKMMLSKAGFHVDVAENGKEAVQKITESPKKYQMVFMDIQMPEMDGIEATKEIRKRESMHESGGKPGRLPIVAMTAHAMKGDREKCIEAGMDDYLTKPIKKETVLEMTYKWSRKKEI